MKKASKSCVIVNGCNSVTVSPPNCDSNRLKSEIFDGFSHVFGSDSSQGEVYEKLMRPMVEEFLNGRSVLLAALGPSGSGKTHTVFGTAKDPGLVPSVLRHIFDPDKGKPSAMSWLFYLSIFEIYSEKGKGEKLSDLSPEGSDIHMQQSVVKGLKEILVKDVAQAESILAYAKSKRATAMTNSNSLSSRSQCIINMRCAADEAEGEGDFRRGEAVLTFVDLAGAEREKKTGNKGGRLLESNFINNTSMVFGLCLRSLLEHQKNPKKPLQKHFQSSLLTRYLRDYLEGRKRMALILTVRAGGEDYFDTSSLLRQASPYMEIKFCDVEETFNLPHIKKRRHIIGNEQHKRAKLNGADARDDAEMTYKDSENFPIGGSKKNHASRVGENSHPEVKCTESNLQRQYNIMQGFAKALWAVLKQYKERVKTMQKDIDVLTDNLKVGHAQYLVMEKELLNLKSQCSCPKQVVGVASCPMRVPNSESRFSEELVTDHGRVVCAEVHDIADIECKEKEILHTAGEKCTSHHECERVGTTAPKDSLECSMSESKSITLFWEKNVHFEGEVSDSSTPEAGFPCINSDGRFAGNSASEEENRSGSIKDGSLKLLELESSNVSKVHLEDLPSGPKSFISADAKIDPDVTLLKVSHGATPSSIKSKDSSPQSCRVQQSVMECQISHDKSKNDCHEKDQLEECSKESTDAAAHLPRSSVMDLIVQGESCGCGTPYEKDKENVVNCPRSSIKSELETKEVSPSKPSKPERPRRINSQLETKEVSHSKPSKPKRPKRINSELESKEVSHSKPERPKRRLMPASSLLLRDAGNIDVADENINHRGGRGGRKLDEDEHKRTKGNAHLLRLLKNHLPR